MDLANAIITHIGAPVLLSFVRPGQQTLSPIPAPSVMTLLGSLGSPPETCLTSRRFALTAPTRGRPYLLRAYGDAECAAALLQLHLCRPRQGRRAPSGARYDIARRAKQLCGLLNSVFAEKSAMRKEARLIILCRNDLAVRTQAGMTPGESTCMLDLHKMMTSHGISLSV